MKKARVLLLNPPTAAESTEILLSLAYLASSLRKHGHDAMIVDATAPYKRVDAAGVKRIVREYRPHFIGVTLTITNIPQTYAFLEDLRKLGVPIIAGGSHVNPLPGEALLHGVDIVVIGEGENTIVELAEHFAGNRDDLRSIKGLCMKKLDGTLEKTEPRPLIENLDDIPFPAFEDFPIRNYTGVDDVDSNPIFWAMFSSRGCPFNCIFCCGYNVFGRTYRLRSAQNIFDEIKMLVDKFGVRKVAFQDDEILLSKKRIIDLCDLIRDSGLKIKMSVRARIDSVEQDLLKRMHEAGFRRMSFGVESWNDDTLTGIKKRYDVGKIALGLKVLDESGFPCVNFNTIAGFPWETKAHLKKNLEVLSRIPPGLKYFSIVGMPIPYPNTELYDTYHKRYGFTDWWLDPVNHWDGLPPDRPKPLFFKFARMMTTLYTPDMFWKYSKKWKDEMEDFCWDVFSLYARRHLTAAEFMLAYLLGRASHSIWKISPRLEVVIFGLVPQRFVANVEKKLSFTKAE